MRRGDAESPWIVYILACGDVAVEIYHEPFGRAVFDGEEPKLAWARVGIGVELHVHVEAVGDVVGTWEVATAAIGEQQPARAGGQQRRTSQQK